MSVGNIRVYDFFALFSHLICIFSLLVYDFFFFILYLLNEYEYNINFFFL